MDFVEASRLRGMSCLQRGVHDGPGVGSRGTQRSKTVEVTAFRPVLVRTLPGFVRSHRQHQHLQQRFNGLLTAHRRPVGRVAGLKEMALGPIIILDRGGLVLPVTAIQQTTKRLFGRRPSSVALYT